MPAFEVVAEPSFRKDSFSAKLEEMGIKLFGEGDKATMKAYLRFDDDLPPLTFFIYNQKGKSIFETKPDGLVKTKNYGIGQIIEFLREKKGIKSFVNLDAGEESWETKPSTIGMTWKFDAHTPQKRDDAGNLTDGFTNFTLVDVQASDASSPKEISATPVVSSQPFNVDAWKSFLSGFLKGIAADEKGINKGVVAHAKSVNKTTEQLGLIDRKKALKALCDVNFIDTNEDGDYILKVN